jgi:hypothetical protein
MAAQQARGWPAPQVADCQVKLQRADKLIGGLGGERVRWQATVEQLGADLHNVVGDVLVAAGCIAYSGPFTPTYRCAAGGAPPPASGSVDKRPEGPAAAPAVAHHSWVMWR